MKLRVSLACLAAALAFAPGAAGQNPAGQGAARFPPPDRPVASIVSPVWSSGPDRDVTDENGQLVRGLNIRQGMTVADIGAGSGYHTLRLSRVVGPAGRVYAQDVIAAYLEQLRRTVTERRLGNVEVIQGRADDPRLPANTIDRAILVHMYHEIEQPYALLWNLVPAMKAGARVGVIDMDRPTPNHGTPPALLRCEFAAVGYRQTDFIALEGGGGYLAIFEPPRLDARPEPQAIKPCRAR